MELIATIKDQDINPNSLKKNINYKLRRAGRAVVFDDQNNVALLNVTKNGYHKLPGGGVENNESIEEALKRESQEEIGCEIEIIGDVGQIVEFRDKYELKQESYCYLAKVKGNKGQPDFTEKEIREGFSIMWVTISEAIRLISNDKPTNYEGSYIVVRDLKFLERAKESIIK